MRPSVLEKKAYTLICQNPGYMRSKCALQNRDSGCLVPSRVRALYAIDIPPQSPPYNCPRQSVKEHSQEGCVNTQTRTGREERQETNEKSHNAVYRCIDPVTPGHSLDMICELV